MSTRAGRRRFLDAAAACAVGPALPAAVRAQSLGADGGAGGAGLDGESFDAALRSILAGRVPRDAGVTLDLPPLSENGNAVDLTVRIDSPMTAADHVRAIHVLSEKNPAPRVASFRLTPRSGRAEVSTRIRLATTQRVVVLAETSAGALLRAEREVIVVLGACVDGG
ncbi:MAG: thiosulfate oxidation carrier protein SoxY [Burkholderiaceae bacterium]